MAMMEGAAGNGEQVQPEWGWWLFGDVQRCERLTGVVGWSVWRRWQFRTCLPDKCDADLQRPRARGTAGGRSHPEAIQRPPRSHPKGDDAESKRSLLRMLMRRDPPISRHSSWAWISLLLAHTDSQLFAWPPVESDMMMIEYGGSCQ